MKKYILCLLMFGFLVNFSCTDDTANADEDMEEVDDEEIIIWDGPVLQFTKEAEADPALEENQDRITDNVWITRGIGKGEIYNIKSETESTKGISPVGTQWAIGSIDDLENLTFADLRTTIGDSIKDDILNKDLVLHLTEENIYIYVKFTSWAPGGSGFSYERSTASEDM